MSNHESDPARPDSTRDERLAARLRENLRRRKAQARAIEARATDTGPRATPLSKPGQES